MPKKAFILTALAVLLAAGVLLWLNRKQPQAPPAAEPPSATSDSPTPTKPAPRPDPAAPRPENPAVFSDDFRDPRLRILTQQDSYTPTLQELSGFLAAHQRSPESLLAAFGVCRDQSLLDELLHSDPGERTWQAVMLWSEDDAAVAESIAALKKANPKNPIPYLREAPNDSELGPEQVKKIFAAIGDSPVIDLSSLRQQQLRNEAWQSVVKDPVKAWAYSLQTLSFDLETLDTLSNGILDLQTTGQSESENPDARHALSLVEALRQADSGMSNVSQSKENSLEMEILSTVPSDSTLPGSRQTVQERLDQLQAAMEKDGDIDERIQDFLRQADPATVEAFVSRWNSEGIDPALKSLPAKAEDNH